MTKQDHHDEAVRLMSQTMADSPNANALHSGLIMALTHSILALSASDDPEGTAPGWPV
jgi:hypothetical protein